MPRSSNVLQTKRGNHSQLSYSPIDSEESKSYTSFQPLCQRRESFMSSNNRVEPQLARKCYTIHTDDDDNDDGGNSSDSSLEILSPVKATVVTEEQANASQSTIDEAQQTSICRTFTSTTTTKGGGSLDNPTAWSSSDEDDDEELLRRHTGPTFAARSSRPVASRGPSQSTRLTTQCTSTNTSTRQLPSSTIDGSPSSSSRRKRSRNQTTQQEGRMKEIERRNRQKKLARQVEQRERGIQKEIERVTKIAERTATQQSNGKFAKKEIVVLLDPTLYPSDTTTTTTMAATAGASNTTTAKTPDDNHGYGLVNAIEKEEYSVKAFQTKSMTYKKTVQWVRREHVLGGAEEAWKLLLLSAEQRTSEGGIIPIPHLVVLMDYQDYIPLISAPCRYYSHSNSDGEEEGDDGDADGDGNTSEMNLTIDDDFPRLEEWLTTLKREWHDQWKTTTTTTTTTTTNNNHDEPHITLVLNQVGENLHKEWNLRKKRRNNNNKGKNPTTTTSTTESSSSSSSVRLLPTDWEFRDSLQWLLIQYRVDSIHCTDVGDIQDTILKFTRALSEAPYISPPTELECIRKIKPGPDVPMEGDDFSKVQDTWYRQLQMIPMISEIRSRSVIQHFPTPLSLWQAYHQNTQNKKNGSNVDKDEEDETSRTNMNLLNTCFGSGRIQSHLSATVYKIMTSNDPNELI